MSLGSILMKFRQKFGHGINVTYYRDYIRPKILKTQPITNTDDSVCEIHILTCADDWLNAIWALKTFYWKSNVSYSLCIHDDGSLPSESIQEFQKHFPSSRLIKRIQSDHVMNVKLSDFPNLHAFRNHNVLAPKILDFPAFLESDRLLVFDSDLMFFKKPQYMISRIENKKYAKNLFNADFASAYTVDAEEVLNTLGFSLIECINSGFGLAHKNSLIFERMEHYLTLPGILNGHPWRIEQTLYALCSSSFGVDLLPNNYTLYLDSGLQNKPFRHYVGAIRHWMYSEGMKHFIKNNHILFEP